MPDDKNDKRRTRILIPPLEWRPIDDVKTVELFRQEIPELRGLADDLKKIIADALATRH
jgi:hypothetical protein